MPISAPPWGEATAEAMNSRTALPRPPVVQTLRSRQSSLKGGSAKNSRAPGTVGLGHLLLTGGAYVAAVAYAVPGDRRRGGGEAQGAKWGRGEGNVAVGTRTLVIDAGDGAFLGRDVRNILRQRRRRNQQRGQSRGLPTASCEFPLLLLQLHNSWRCPPCIFSSSIRHFRHHAHHPEAGAHQLVLVQRIGLAETR